MQEDTPMKDKAGDPEAEPRRPRQEVMILTELEQIKVLADPLRIRILEELSEERTTKQVAGRIGEKPTKLYHHIEALERVGLISLTRTRQNRGTLEKYYLAVAMRYQADSRVFANIDDASDEERETLHAMISTLFDTTKSELIELAETSGTMACVEELGIVSFSEVRTSKKNLLKIRDRLRKLVEELTTADDETEEEGRYRLTLAYFPLPDPEDDGD